LAWLLSFALVLALAIYLLQRRRSRHEREEPPLTEIQQACGDYCGSDRWSVKTLSDPDAPKVNMTPQVTTVTWLRSQLRPVDAPQNARIAPIEMQAFQVTARLVAFGEQADRDVHVILSDLHDPSVTMITEIPSLSCAGACSSAHAVSFRDARLSLTSRFGDPTRQLRAVHDNFVVVVTGIGFFDYEHGQVGGAPNGIELHPVLSIEFQ